MNYIPLVLFLAGLSAPDFDVALYVLLTAMANESSEFLHGIIEKGKEYPVLFNEDIENDVFALQYTFKPANLNMHDPGSLLVEDNKEATVELAKIDDSREVFKGSAEDSEENEYLLVFENGQFKVCKVNRFINGLKPVRSDGKTTKSRTTSRKSVTTEIRMRIANAKKRKAGETSAPEVIENSATKPNVEGAILYGVEINSLDDLLS